MSLDTHLLTDRDALLRAICDDPADGWPRLQFADLMEEQGQAERAEFIRVQLELARRFGVPNAGEPVITGDRAEDAVETRLRNRELQLLYAVASGHRHTNWYEWAGVALQQCYEESTSGKEPDPVDWEYRRGFVAAIKCQLADWYGQTCEGCYDSDAHGFAGHGNWRRSECPHCHGTGRVGGHGPAIVRANPIESVRLTDREPYVNVMNDHVWLSSVLHQPTEKHTLPQAVFALLCGGALSGSGTARYYGNEDDADAALSTVLILWAKGVTGKE